MPNDVPDGGEGVGLNPLSVTGSEIIDEKELMSTFSTTDGKSDGSTGTIDGNTGSSEFTSSDTGESIIM